MRIAVTTFGSLSPLYLSDGGFPDAYQRRQLAL